MGDIGICSDLRIFGIFDIIDMRILSIFHILLVFV
jgi:hypothetical protein